jgi:hypothetical protein
VEQFLQLLVAISGLYTLQIVDNDTLLLIAEKRETTVDQLLSP